MFSAKIFVSLSWSILQNFRKNCGGRYNLCTSTVIQFHQLYWHNNKLTLVSLLQTGLLRALYQFYLKFKLFCSESTAYSIWVTDEALPPPHFIAEHDIIWHGVSLRWVWGPGCVPYQLLISGGQSTEWETEKAKTSGCCLCIFCHRCKTQHCKSWCEGNLTPSWRGPIQQA